MKRSLMKRANERIVFFFKRPKGPLVDLDLGQLLTGNVNARHLTPTTLYRAHRYELACAEEILPVLRAMAKKVGLEVVALREQVTFSPYSEEDEIPFAAPAPAPVSPSYEQKNPLVRLFIDAIDRRFSVCLVSCDDMPTSMFHQLNKEFDFCLFLKRWHVGSLFDYLYIVWTPRPSYEETARRNVIDTIKNLIRNPQVVTVFEGE